MKKKTMRFVRRRKWVRAHRLIGLVETEILHALSFVSNDGKKASMGKIPFGKITDNPITTETKVIDNDTVGKQTKNDSATHNENKISKNSKKSSENIIHHEIVDHEMEDIDEEEIEEISVAEEEEEAEEHEHDDYSDNDSDPEENKESSSSLHNSKSNEKNPDSAVSLGNTLAGGMSLGKGDTGQYRLREYKRGKDLIVGLCQERSSCMSSSILIPWEQISSVEMISPSVLSISLQVHRYFGEDKGKQVFRPADVELFITNCPSLQVRSMVEERIKFAHIRSEIKSILSSGNVTGVPTVKRRKDPAFQLATYNRPPSRTVSISISPAVKKKIMKSLADGNSDIEGESDEDEEDEEDEGESNEEKKGKESNVFDVDAITSKFFDNDDEDDDEGEEEGEEEEEDGDDEDISRAAEASAFLDSEALDLERRAEQLEKLFFADRSNISVLGEREVIVRRACRFRAYIGALYGAKLEGVHHLNNSEVQHMMIKDFDTALQIDMGDEVATANNKMEFLLDKAESRLRDTAICGWSKTEASLLKCLELVANGYFIELVGLLAQFFKGHSTMKNIQGLQSKMQLITTYMRHDDRLALMLESAIRPFDMSITPRPLLSLLLNLDTLLAWYSSVLHQEMKACVDSVVNIWRDVTKDAGGLAAKYRYPLPWNPMRKMGELGQFQTLLPEDCTAYLLQYIALTRLSEENIAMSFRKHVHKLDANVHLSFASAYKYLADIYTDSLRTKDWTKTDPRILKQVETDGSTHVVMKNDNEKVSNSESSNIISTAFGGSSTDDFLLDENEREQLDTQIEWLCSVANDSRRITEEAMISKCKITSSYDNSDEMNMKGGERGMTAESLQIARVSDKAYDSFTRVTAKAIDFISCIIFKTLLGVVDEFKILEKEVFKRWKSSLREIPTINTEVQVQVQVPSSQSTSTLIDYDFLLELLNEKSEYLQPYCHYKLLCLCIDKNVMIYLNMLKDERTFNKSIPPNGSEIMQLNKDIKKLHKCYLTASTQNDELKNYSDAILMHIRPLKQAVSLLSCGRDSKEFEQVLESLYKVSLLVICSFFDVLYIQ